MKAEKGADQWPIEKTCSLQREAGAPAGGIDQGNGSEARFVHLEREGGLLPDAHHRDARESADAGGRRPEPLAE